MSFNGTQPPRKPTGTAKWRETRRRELGHILDISWTFEDGWVKDSKENVIKRPRKEIANTLTRFTGKNGFTEADGLCNTTPYIIIKYD